MIVKLVSVRYPAGQVTRFLHSQLIDAVNTHAHVLKDSLSLIRQLESLTFSRELNSIMGGLCSALLFN